MPHKIAPRAADDLRDLWFYGFERFGLNQANAYADGLERAFLLLAENPRVARLRSELQPPVRAWRYRAHMIIFDVEDDGTVIILRVRHGREDWISDPLGD